MIVYKYRLPLETECAIDMPIGSRVLSVQMQHGVPMVWALVDPEEMRGDPHWFFVFGTGTPIDYDITGSFLGTLQLEGGRLVLHVWDNGEGLPQ